MNIIITGASRGIGYELAKYFTKEYKCKIFVLSRNTDKLNQLKKECYKINANSNITILTCDVSDKKNIETAFNKIKEQVSHIDILINNAGALINAPFEDINPNKLEYTYNINVFAPFYIIQNTIPLLKNTKKGHVVNISSMGGYQGSVKFPGLTAYSSSKAAIANLTECLAEEYKDTDIKFNCIALGAVNTEMLQEAFPGYKAPINASEMANYIGGFAINGSSYFNGKIIPVSSSTP